MGELTMGKRCGNCDNGKWLYTKEAVPEICTKCEYVFGEPSNWKEKPKTNADKIRAMSDEELAQFMFSMVDCVSCQNKLMNNGKLVFGADRKTCTDKDYYAMCDGDGRKCESVCLEWLKQPAEGE